RFASVALLVFLFILWEIARREVMMFLTSREFIMAKRATKRKKQGAIVLGAQMAAAEEAERQHQATRTPANSPMPKAVYDYYRGDMDLHDPVQRPLDAKLAKLCHKFANADAT